ncbi:MAG: in-like serine protease [Acidimicrobiales bacterium]|nr:in-like serine protease [Acidimicrobiales bacterium]
MNRVRRGLAGPALAVLIAAAAVVALGSAAANASAFTVTNNHDAGAGSLRAAIAAAAASSADDTITVQPGVGTITLASPLTFAPNGALTLFGNGVHIDANGNNGALHETAGVGNLTLDGISVTGANASGKIAGAIVVQSKGTFTLSNCTIRGNHATGAATQTDAAAVIAIGLSSPVVVDRCSITDNSTSAGSAADAAGGIDDEQGPITITDTDISRNAVTTGANSVTGGGIDVEGGSTTLVRTSITNNTASTTARGDLAGGSATEGGPLTAVNSTISENRASGPAHLGGGGVLSEGGPVHLTYTTIASNIAPAGDTPTSSAQNMRNDGGVLEAFASVITPKTTAFPNCIQSSSTTSHGYSYSDDASCGFTAGTDHQSAPTAMLEPVAANGGIGPTQLPHLGSPLIDAIPAGQCQAANAAGVTTDERGVTRPRGNGCDIGAVELAPRVPPTGCPANPTANQRFVCNLYLDVLGRTVEAGGLVYWADRLDAGTPRSTMARQYVLTPEARSVLVNRLYVLYLGRAGESAGVAYWSDQIGRGVSPDTVRVLLVASSEYYGRAGGTNQGFVAAVYRDILRRTIDPSGQAYWDGQLASGHSRGDVVTRLLHTNEGRKNVITDIFNRYLRRPPNASESSFWITALGNGASELDIDISVIASAEYYNR